jgi:hypothetical protein
MAHAELLAISVACDDLRARVADRLEREGVAAYADELLPRMLSDSSITALRSECTSF